MYIEVVGGSSGVDGTCFALPFPRDYLHFDLIFIENLDFIACELLISGLIHLICASEVDP